MPFYEINHTTSLTAAQQEQLAKRITDIHSSKFRTPRVFVNVAYKDISQVKWFVAGHQRHPNHISAYVRPGGGRKTSEFDEVSTQIVAAWDEIVKPGSGTNDPDKLRSIFILGALTTGWEAGFTIPPAGEDGEWLRKNMEEFRRMAANGDEEMKQLVADVESRPEFGL